MADIFDFAGGAALQAVRWASAPGAARLVLVLDEKPIFQHNKKDLLSMFEGKILYYV